MKYRIIAGTYQGTNNKYYKFLLERKFCWIPFWKSTGNISNSFEHLNKMKKQLESQGIDPDNKE